VVDLDNTLWGGVIGEDGLAGIQVGPDGIGNAFLAFQQELEKLWRRGILLAVCSKNNSDDALAALSQHPDMILRPSHFAAMRINWQSKSTNIREIAHELNIGLDSLVFLDDNPVERAVVSSEISEVLTPEMPQDPAGYRRALLEIVGVFDTLAFTDEDRQRNQQYAEQRARLEAQAEMVQTGSLDDYLASLEIVVDIEPVTPVTLPRVAQLTNKTNQFNLTTRRYTEGEIADKQAGGSLVLTARVRDRFGDSGLTGVVIADPSGDELWTIDTLLLSCRVMGRGVEAALLSSVVEGARDAGATCLQGWYLPTQKNDVVRDTYHSLGFVAVEQHADGRALWRLDMKNVGVEAPSWLTVRAPARI
jgi:FkbH-like protein